jgi:hypothetical protein
MMRYTSQNSKYMLLYLTADNILYGIGQGSCASPILWALLKQLLLAALEEKFYCIHLVEVGGVKSYSRPGDSFVDDTTCGPTNNDVTMDPEDRSKTALSFGGRHQDGRKGSKSGQTAVPTLGA